MRTLPLRLTTDVSSSSIQRNLNCFGWPLWIIESLSIGVERPETVITSTLRLSVESGLSVHRVEIAHHLVKAGGIEMGVDLGGLDAGMTQQLL